MNAGDRRNDGSRSLWGQANRIAANAQTGNSTSVAMVQTRPVNSQRRITSEEERAGDPGLALVPLSVALLKHGEIEVAVGTFGDGWVEGGELIG